MAGINTGSEWRKWDLHIHTPKTLCSEYGGDTHEVWERYITELERLSEEKHLRVVGINDYLFLDGYKKVLEYKKEGRLAKIDLILPVVEFRLKEFVGNNELKRLNYHIIFADDALLPIAQIETHFLTGLRGKGNLEVATPDGYTWGGVITRETLIELGQHIIDATPAEKRTAMKPLDVGFNNINFELSKIEELLGEGNEPSVYLKGKYFKAIGKAEWEAYRWDGSALDKKSIINKTHFVFSASPSAQEALSGRAALKNNAVNSRLLHCSDAHGFAKDTGNTKPKELGHCSTWVKSQPTFEGLRQLLYEPEERISIQKEMPESDKLENLIIKKVQFQSTGNKFTGQEIYFNKNLNVIIGGKSSGKSILLYNIAKTLYEDSGASVLKYKDSDDDYREKDLYSLGTDDAGFDFTVENYLGISQSINRSGGKSSILPSIKYIPQNHLSNLVDKSKKNSSVLKEYIRDLILEDPASQKSYDEFLEKVRANDKKRENDVNTYFGYQEELEKKNAELKHKGDKTAIGKTILALEEKIREISKQMTEAQTQEYNALNQEFSAVKVIENSLNNDHEKLKNYVDTAGISLNDLKTKKTLLTDNLEIPEVKAHFGSELGYIDAASEANKTLKGLLEKDQEGSFIIRENNLFFDKLTAIGIKIKDLETKLAPYNKLFENQKQVEGFQKTIAEEKVKRNEIEQIEKEARNINETAQQLKNTIFEDIRANRAVYNELLEKLNRRIETIRHEDPELNVQGTIYFNFPKYRRNILEISHGNSRSYDNFEILRDDKKALMAYDFEAYLGDLKAIFDAIEQGRYTTLKNISKQDAIRRMLTDYFFDHWDITYRNDTIHNMSTGKASLVLLKVMIKLSSTKGPILIDQPEDNLDNRSVTNELVQYLKEKKKERQIILVTHNANIVVNGDAENIIVANQRGQSEDDQQGSPYIFDYINGALEDSNPKNTAEKDLLRSMGIREHIAEIVEGGKEAFKKREEKYGFR